MRQRPASAYERQLPGYRDPAKTCYIEVCDSSLYFVQSMSASIARLPPEPGPYARHLPALDGVRGLAILLVMASHLFPGNTANGGCLLRWTGIALTHGGIGVDLFFVLSGFLITGILYDSVQERHFFRTFYARRILRIFPLYYAVLILLFLLTGPLHIHWQGMEWPLLLYLQNTSWVMPLYRFHPATTISLDHFWSLAVEEQFYLVWPFLVYLFARRRSIVVVCLTLSFVSLCLRLVLALRATDFNIINRDTICRADALLLGAMLAVLLRAPLWHDRILRLAPQVAVAAFLLLASGVGLQAVLPRLIPAWRIGLEACTLSLRYSVLAIFFTAFLALCLRHGSIYERVFSWPGLRFFGRYSYGLYVLHLVPLPFLLGYFRELIAQVTPSKGISVVGAGLLSFGVAVLAAVFSYHFFERPFLRLKRYFEYDRSMSRPGASGTT